jgi:3-deoxy-D-manno-octulosonic-acid transferase
MLVEASRAGVPLAMVNARMSARSFDRWAYAPAFIRDLLQRFEMSLAQTYADAERLLGLGAKSAPVIGNLKFDAPAPPADRQELAALSGLTSGRRIWIAASTHSGEERIAAEAHLRLRETFPDALTLIAPRHPERGQAIAAELESLGIACALRSRGQRPGRETTVYICDTMGELGLFYRLAGVVLVGKSLGHGGGQNPIEPAKLASAILHGPNVGNFADVYGLLDAQGGAVLTRDAAEIAAALSALFADGARLRAMARIAAEVVERQGGAVERAMAALAPQLEAIRP